MKAVKPRTVLSRFGVAPQTLTSEILTMLRFASWLMAAITSRAWLCMEMTKTSLMGSTSSSIPTSPPGHPNWRCLSRSKWALMASLTATILLALSSRPTDRAITPTPMVSTQTPLPGRNVPSRQSTSWKRRVTGIRWARISLPSFFPSSLSSWFKLSWISPMPMRLMSMPRFVPWLIPLSRRNDWWTLLMNVIPQLFT